MADMISKGPPRLLGLFGEDLHGVGDERQQKARGASPGRSPLNGRFSPRQVEIVGLVATGASDKEIAGRLGISVPTVRTHLQRLFRATGIRNRAEAVALLFTNDGPRDNSADL